MAVGAYTTAKLLGEEAGGPPLAVVLLGATVAGAVAGLLAGAAAARLRGPYLAGATLALAVGLPAIAQRFPDVPRRVERPDRVPADAARRAGRDVPARALAGVDRVRGRAGRLRRAGEPGAPRLGRSFRAVRDDEVAAELAGLHVARMQVLAFVVSAACAGLAAGCSSSSRRWPRPGPSRSRSRSRCSPASILGGLGSLAGAVWGAAALALIPTWADDASGAWRSRRTCRRTSRSPSTAPC